MERRKFCKAGYEKGNLKKFYFITIISSAITNIFSKGVNFLSKWGPRTNRIKMDSSM